MLEVGKKGCKVLPMFSCFVAAVQEIHDNKESRTRWLPRAIGNLPYIFGTLSMTECLALSAASFINRCPINGDVTSKARGKKVKKTHSFSSTLVCSDLSKPFYCSWRTTLMSQCHQCIYNARCAANMFFWLTPTPYFFHLFPPPRIFFIPVSISYP